ncbi:hypothetical protein ACTWQB_16230 [Piscibacillus sp. B03]|uniref:hypothetical protein n=1 Tax=Piscibacillus sp. B03 TaxID=3457430 RepID=UPI003FCE50C9
MPEMLRMILVTLISILLMVTNVYISQQSRATTYLKEDLEVAVHDAALQLDVEALSEGDIVFNQDEAEETFIETLEINTGLTPENYRIVEIHFFDINTVDEFPHEYESLNVNFEDTILHPTILVIVETEVDSFFPNSDKEQIVRRAASYTYE